MEIYEYFLFGTMAAAGTLIIAGCIYTAHLNYKTSKKLPMRSLNSGKLEKQVEKTIPEPSASINPEIPKQRTLRK